MTAHTNELPKCGPVEVDELMPVVGHATARLIETARVFVARGETLVVSGPTGAGKSRLARWCHHQSPQADRPFVTLDLLSVPEDLQMAEFVGWKRGAFTGASSNVAGALERAAGGTLFIDEIDKLSLKAQAGLLRVLEDRRYRVLGDDTRDCIADVQFIIGTNTDLFAAVRAGRFREDLYYRINVLRVQWPGLAERRDEIPGWSSFMLTRCGRESEAQARLSSAAIEALCSYDWPGNLRQLDNVIRRSYAFALIDNNVDVDGAPLVDAAQIKRALEFEDGDTTTLADQLWSAAQAIAREAVRRHDNGEDVMNLEIMDGLRGLVLRAAVQLTGSREDAFRLFGREYLLVGRNHHREFKRQLTRARELLLGLDERSSDPQLQVLLDGVGSSRPRSAEPGLARDSHGHPGSCAERGATASDR